MRNLWEKWTEMRLGYRVNAVLYLLGGVSLVALVLELAFGGGEATAKVVASQAPTTTRPPAPTTTFALPTTTLATLPPATTPTTAPRNTTNPPPFVPDPNDAVAVGPRNTTAPTDPPVEPTVPVETTVPPTVPTTQPPPTTTPPTTTEPAAELAPEQSQNQGIVIPVPPLDLLGPG